MLSKGLCDLYVASCYAVGYILNILQVLIIYIRLSEIYSHD